MKLPLAIIGLTWTSLWLTPDQQGQRAMERGDFEQAAKSFESTMYKGVALYRDGDFKQAQAVFSRVDSAEAHYNRGNCLVLLGQYDDAVASYDRALTRKPEWTEAIENRELAVLRAEKTRKQGGEMGDQKIGADKIVFD
ncbi:MAG: tetratricopeptide repeat protein, partial [Verrucomicrobiota bacterium]